MIDNNKTYAFTIAVKELRETVPNIWRYAAAYKRLKGLKSKGLWEMFVEPKPEEEKKDVPQDPETPPLPEEILRSDPGRNGLPEIDPETMEGESYNMCHFWSNFEIARLSFFRSKEYEEFFEMMDRSGGFWMERVCCLVVILGSRWLTFSSGVMRPSTPSPLVRSFPPKTSTTSAILDTGTPPFSIVPRTRLLADSCPASDIWRRLHWMNASDSKRMTIGSTGTLPRRTAWAAAAAATPTSLTWRARRAAAWRNGSMWLVDGPAHRQFLDDHGLTREIHERTITYLIDRGGHDGDGYEEDSARH